MVLLDRSTYAIALPNLPEQGPRDNGWPIHQSDDLIVLYLFFCLLVPVGLELYHL